MPRSPPAELLPICLPFVPVYSTQHSSLLDFMLMMIIQCSSVSGCLYKAAHSREAKAPFNVISKLAEGALQSCTQTTDKCATGQDLEWTPDTAGDSQQTRCSPIHYSPLCSAIKPLHHPRQHELLYLTVGQFVQEESVREISKALLKARKTTAAASLHPLCGRPHHRGNQIAKVGFSLTHAGYA